jgi:hypothetical protein
MESFERPLSEEEWYDTARAKIESFIHNIDPDLEVLVTPTTIHQKGMEAYDTLSLSFKHKSDFTLRWTMEIQKNFNYIENDLENVVRKIYEERIKGV